MPHILVTGGAGFIGSHVAEAFAAKGYQVSILDNFSTGRRENVPQGVKVYEGDITDSDFVTKVMQEARPDVLDHHAAQIQVSTSVKNPRLDASINILGTLTLMEAARQVGSVKKVVFASTGGAMYGDKPVPFSEDMEPQPLSPYGIAKRSAELYLYFYFVQYHIPFVVLRYANVYGPRQNPHGESGVIAIFMERIHEGKPVQINGDGTHTRDYVYVSDVAHANLLALSYGKIGTFNIGTGVETSTNDIFRKVTAAMQANIEEMHGPERPGEQVRSVLSSVLAQKELGWQPTVQLDEGIAKTVASFAAPAT